MTNKELIDYLMKAEWVSPYTALDGQIYYKLSSKIMKELIKKLEENEPKI